MGAYTYRCDPKTFSSNSLTKLECFPYPHCPYTPRRTKVESLSKIGFDRGGLISRLLKSFRGPPKKKLPVQQFHLLSRWKYNIFCLSLSFDIVVCKFLVENLSNSSSCIIFHLCALQNDCIDIYIKITVTKCLEISKIAKYAIFVPGYPLAKTQKC